jgi:antibiotic biosynthesis monooxygenase (ABM) superfamily enzyme
MRAKPSHGELLRGRASELCDTARTFPGYLHSNIRVRDAGGAQEIIVGLSFRHAKDLAVWEQRATRRASAGV